MRLYKMIFVVVASALVATVLGAGRDPTTICLPEVFQAYIFAFQNDVTGIAAFDFPNERLSIRATNGLRTVYNLRNASAVAINETVGRCIQLPNDPRLETISTRCLPANAVQVGNLTTFIGSGINRTEFEGFEFSFPGIGTVTAALTTTDPPIPILRQYTSEDGKDNEVVFFFNVQTTVDDETIFNVPDDCLPLTVVGK